MVPVGDISHKVWEEEGHGAPIRRGMELLGGGLKEKPSQELDTGGPGKYMKLGAPSSLWLRQALK